MDASTHRKITTVIAAVAALGALGALFAYFENKQHKAMQMELMSIDKQIKELDLHHKKERAGVNA